MLLSPGNYSLHTDPVAQMSYQIQELRAYPLAFYRLLECDPVTRECVEENRSRLRYNRTLYESVVSQIMVYECLLEATKYGYGGEHCRWHAGQRDRLDPFRVKEFTPKGPDLRMVVTAYAERDLAEQEKFVESQQRQLEKAQESSAASPVVVTSWAEPGSSDTTPPRHPRIPDPDPWTVPEILRTFPCGWSPSPVWRWPISFSGGTEHARAFFS